MASRRTPLVMGLIALLAGCGASAAEPDLGSAGQIAPVGKRVAAPRLTGSYVGGGSLDLAALRGHVVVLNVFGSWCGPCQAEQSGLSTLSDVMTGSGVKFVGIAERDDDADVQTYQRHYHVNYPAIEDETGSLVAKFRSLPVSAVPSTLIIDKQGREAARFVTPVEAGALTPVISSLNAEPS